MIVGLAGRQSTGATRDEIMSVTKRYFELAKEQILDGGEWDFDGAFQVCVHTRKVRNQQLTGPNGRVKINIRRIGETNDVVGYGGALARRKYRFVASYKMDCDLNVILENTNKEYRYAPIK